MTNKPVSRRLFLEHMGLAGALALTPHWSRAAESPPGKKLGVALVGLGNYSTHQLGPALRETKFCALTGVVTGSRAKGEQWARDYGFSQKSIYSYDTMARVANDPAIDIVYVVTPNGLHAEHAIAAAKAGKHVILEKPMCVTVAECDTVLAACKAANVRHSIGYRLFWDPYHMSCAGSRAEQDFGSFQKMKGDRGFVMSTWRWRAGQKTRRWWAAHGPRHLPDSRRMHGEKRRRAGIRHSARVAEDAARHFA